jgi:HlyD family secretion protein
MINNILRIIKIPYISVVLILVIGSGAYLILKNKDDLGFDFAPAGTGALERVINVTGRVGSVSSVDLAFENSGKIASVSVDVGDRVFAGQTLISQVSSGISADLAQAKARLKSEESKFEELKRGARPEEIAVQKIKVESAEINLQKAKQALVDEIRNSYTKADDAVTNKVDQIFSNPTTDNPKLNISVNNSQYKINAESGRISSGRILKEWKVSVNNLTINNDLELKGNEARNNILMIQNFLEDISLVVNSLEVNPNLTQATIDGYKSNMSTARSNMDTAMINLSTDIDGLRSDTSSLNLAREELILMEAGSDPQAILSGEAKVEEAVANVEKFQSELNKRFIVAPISGLVTFVEILPGEIVSGGEVVVSLISDNDLEVTANVPETDIVEVFVGNEASIELDAYSDGVIFKAKVVKIDPAETIIEGVPVYKTTFVFTNSDQRIRSGMTADIDILIARKESVLAIPRRAIFEEGGKEFVRVWDGMEIVKKEVQTGLVGSDGKIEILSGISIGENVITFIKDEELLNN